VIIDIQRGGPSTGLPTKDRAADLLQAVYGRNSEGPVCVIAASTPGNCFTMAIEAVRLATKYMTPVILLTDGYLANGTEPWRIPNIADLPKIDVKFRTDPAGFTRSCAIRPRSARNWAIPGTPELMHRIGGSRRTTTPVTSPTRPTTTSAWCKVRAAKIAGIANDIPPLEDRGRRRQRQAARARLGLDLRLDPRSRAALPRRGLSVSHAHLRYINPFPKNLGELLKRFDRVLIPELNLGQLVKLIRSRTWCPPRAPQGPGATVQDLRARGKIRKSRELSAEQSPREPHVEHHRAAKLTKKDFEDRSGRALVPGLRDYSILAIVQRMMPELGIPREKIVWVSGIGCSSRFPYYMNTYGFHTIHGPRRRSRWREGGQPELSGWLATGDGDGLSIGGNHLMHCLRAISTSRS
jgi:hypothetical protein